MHLPLGGVNAYLIKTDCGFFLIDTGLALSRAKLEKMFKLNGLTPGDIKLVIITHGDLDHIGNCAYLQKKYGLKIAVHEADAGQCRTGKTNFNRKRKASLPAKILQPVIQALLLKPLMKVYPLETFQPDIMLTDGQDLNHFGLDAKVIHIPGHTMGSIGILTGNGQFFSGDTINNRKKPTIGDIVENEEALVSSIGKIKKLTFRNIYPGHGSPFSASDSRLAKAFADFSLTTD